MDSQLAHSAPARSHEGLTFAHRLVRLAARGNKLSGEGRYYIVEYYGGQASGGQRRLHFSAHYSNTRLVLVGFREGERIKIDKRAKVCTVDGVRGTSPLIEFLI